MGEDLNDMVVYLLAVSRRSTFFPSLERFSPDEWDLLLNQYGDQPITALIRSLEVPYQETLEMFLDRGVDLQKGIKEQREVFSHAIECGDMQEYLRRHCLEARKGLREYLKQMGFQSGQETVAVVDIGWRGTIQDNLCKLFPEKTLCGYYLGMIQTINPQPPNAIKQGYMNRLPLSGALLKSHTQMEMLCTSPMGTTLGYAVQPDGRYSPVFAEDTKDIGCWNQYARFYQQGVLRNLNCARKTKIREYCGALRISLFPNQCLARAFFNFEYSEIFGLGKDVNLSNLRFTLRPFLAALKGISGLHALREYLNRTMWPQGFLRIHGMTMLIPIYNVILLITVRRHDK